ncbi:hypothetical protein SAMN05444166_5571 [Singulisphaera sp. GP187]|nr:hypothetical protein SAMN05444166_5571 [Singulisphaera sp. GP187]
MSPVSEMITIAGPKITSAQVIVAIIECGSVIFIAAKPATPTT